MIVTSSCMSWLEFTTAPDIPQNCKIHCIIHYLKSWSTFLTFVIRSKVIYVLWSLSFSTFTSSLFVFQEYEYSSGNPYWVTAINLGQDYLIKFSRLDCQPPSYWNLSIYFPRHPTLLNLARFAFSQIFWVNIVFLLKYNRTSYLHYWTYKWTYLVHYWYH